MLFKQLCKLRERKREREKERKRERDRQRERKRGGGKGERYSLVDKYVKKKAKYVEACLEKGSNLLVRNFLYYLYILVKLWYKCLSVAKRVEESEEG